MIKADLVNPRSLSETVRNDVNTELWMRYICSSPQVRQALSGASSKAKSLYKDSDFKSRLSFLALAAALAGFVPASLYRSTPMLIAGCVAAGLFIWFESTKKTLLIELSKELVTGLYPDTPPKGTFFQFGEDLARKYPVTSFIDFNRKLDRMLERCFITLFPIAVLLYINTSLVIILLSILLLFIWPFFFRPARVSRLILRLR